MFVQCSSCGVPFGTMDYFNNGTQLEEIKSAVASLKKDIQWMKNDLEDIKRAIDRKG